MHVWATAPTFRRRDLPGGLSFDVDVSRQQRFANRLPDALPSNQGVRLDNEQDRTPARPELRLPDPEDPVAPGQSRPFRSVLQDGELLPESEVLGGQLGSAMTKLGDSIRDRDDPAG